MLTSDRRERADKRRPEGPKRAGTRRPKAGACLLQGGGDGLFEGRFVAVGPGGHERVFAQRLAGGGGGVVVVGAGDGREGGASLVTQGGGRAQEPRGPLRPALHGGH